MAPTELVTAVQERLKITVVALVNGGYQSIHQLQRSTVRHSFGTEFRDREGRLVPIDYVANAESLGCAAFRARMGDELERALAAARECTGPALVECHVEPTPAPDSGAWWDLGVPEVAGDAAVAETAEAHRAGVAGQRFHG